MGAVCFGECMIELSRGPGGAARVGYGGDTANTAIYLARLGIETAYMTALGTDAWSGDLKAAWASEGLDLGLVATHPTRAADWSRQ
jgi:2-dehydro-3-deoxygluconokinase